jgi:hypothetical protein
MKLRLKLVVFRYCGVNTKVNKEEPMGQNKMCALNEAVVETAGPEFLYIGRLIHSTHVGDNLCH